MKNTLSRLLKQATKIKLDNGDELRPGCNQQQIIQLKNETAIRLNLQIPEAFLDFLNQMDGYSSFDFMLYASHPVYLEKTKSRVASWIFGLIETNQNGEYFPLLALGESGDDIFIYDDRLKLYKNMDRYGNTNAEFESFWPMIDDRLRYLI